MIVTHTSPDFDAIGYVWLMRRFGGAGDMPVTFVNTGSPDPAVLASAWSVGDTGRVYDPATRRFDHHQFPGHASNETCATRQAYDWLCATQGATLELTAIRPIIELIFRGDTGSPLAGADTSRTVGIHALLSAQKAKHGSDADLLAYGGALLDDLADVAIMRARGRDQLEQYTTYRSNDGLIVALDGAPHSVTAAAFDAGAVLVFFASEDRGSFARGVQRAAVEHGQPHVGVLIDLVATSTPHIDMITELSHWFLHPAGFFAGRGTAKAPCPTPMRDGLTISMIAAAVDGVWSR